MNAQEACPTAFPGGPACFGFRVQGAEFPRIIRLLIPGYTVRNLLVWEGSVNAQEAWPTAFPGGPACFGSSVQGLGYRVWGARLRFEG